MQSTFNRWILKKGETSFKRRDAQQELTRFREVERLERRWAYWRGGILCLNLKR